MIKFDDIRFNNQIQTMPRLLIKLHCMSNLNFFNVKQMSRFWAFQCRLKSLGLLFKKNIYVDNRLSSTINYLSSFSQNLFTKSGMWFYESKNSSFNHYFQLKHLKKCSNGLRKLTYGIKQHKMILKNKKQSKLIKLYKLKSIIQIG